MTSAFGSADLATQALLRENGLGPMRGTAQPKPTKRERVREARLKRSPVGAAKRAFVETEKTFYPVLEALFRLHGLDWWRCENNQRSQPGFPDYEVYGDGWHAWLEVKARSLTTGRAGRLSPAQQRYKASIERGAGEYVSTLLPDEWALIDDWLNGHTGKGIKGTWRAA